MKNTVLIDSIISKCAMKDYMDAIEKNKTKKRKSYQLSSTTIEALIIKDYYLRDMMEEQEYNVLSVRLANENKL